MRVANYHMYPEDTVKATSARLGGRLGTRMSMLGTNLGKSG